MPAVPMFLTPQRPLFHALLHLLQDPTLNNVAHPACMELSKQIQAHSAACTSAQIAADLIQLDAQYLMNTAVPSLYRSLLAPIVRERLIAFTNIAHGLGLSGPLQEGAQHDDVYLTLHQRFKQAHRLKPPHNPPRLPLTSIQDPQQVFECLQSILQHGDLQGIYTYWSRHTFSVYVLRERDSIHLIYVNRGQKHIGATPITPSIIVYTLTPTQYHAFAIHALHAALDSRDRTVISTFLRETMAPFCNPDLTHQLSSKNVQKIGNCTTANGNIAWHLTLTAHLMKENQRLSFVASYQYSKRNYKVLRMEDRALLFIDLVTEKCPDFTPSNQKSSIQQVIEKMVIKDLREPGRQAIKFLLTRLYEQAPEICHSFLDKLLQPLAVAGTSADHWALYTRLQWAETLVKILKAHDTSMQVIIQMQSTIQRLHLSIKIPLLMLAMPSDIKNAFILQNKRYLVFPTFFYNPAIKPSAPQSPLQGTPTHNSNGIEMF